MDLHETVKPDQLVKSIKTDILQMMETNPTSCRIFDRAIAKMMDLSGNITSKDLLALEKNVAAVHKEAGCNFEKNHPFFVQICTI